MVFGLGKEQKVEGLGSNENQVYKFDIKVGDFMKKKKIRLVVTNKRLLLVDRDSNKISDQYDLSRVSVLVVGRFRAVQTSGPFTGQYRDTGKLRFIVDGATVGETKNMFNPADSADGIMQIINSHQPSANSERNTSPSASSHIQDNASQEDPLKILNLRYAKGEISKEEFEEMKEMLK